MTGEATRRLDDETEAYHALCAYSLTRGDAFFIHQLVVDAWALQHATEQTKPMAMAFALIGLCLAIERGRTGREVQLVHMKLGRRKHVWPTFVLPEDRGGVTAIDVMHAPEGATRDRAIHGWCASVWKAYGANREGIVDFLKSHGVS